MGEKERDFEREKERELLINKKELNELYSIIKALVYAIFFLFVIVLIITLF